MNMRTLWVVVGLLSATGSSAAVARGPLPIERVELNPATGTPRLVVFGSAEAGSSKNSHQNTEGIFAFFSLNGAIFGIEHPEEELRVVDDFTGRLGHHHTTLEQSYHGVPVLGAILRLHQRPTGEVSAVNGLFIPDLHLDPTPRLTASEAQIIALSLVAKDIRATSLGQLEAGPAKIWVLRTGLAHGIKGQDHLVWEIEITDHKAIREILYIDAHHGKIVDRFSGIQTIFRQIHRRTYGNTVWREGDDFPYSGGDSSTNEEVNELILGSGDIHALFDHLSGGTYLSWDGHDALMHSVQDFTYDDCPNAFWNGRMTNFCHGMAADDIVAHEWTHAYTQSTHNLLYRYQPGALNEAYSDIFGEIADQINGRGSDDPDRQRADGGCPSTDSSLRWQIGEDSIFGTFRDMWNPACFGDPTRVSQGLYYCGDDDSGGVHTNSGIPNHAFALATDGGAFNGFQVTGIGLNRAAAIWWRAMSVYQVPTTDFRDHADLIELACDDLIGAVLLNLENGEPSGDRITAAHCTEVAKAMTAVEMRLPPEQCAYEPLLEPSPPSISGLNVIFSEDFTTDPLDGDTGWTTTNSGVYSEYESRNWTWVADPPEGSDGNGALWAIDSLVIGDCIPGSDDQSGVMYLDSPPVTLPNSGHTFLLVFDHYVATEGGWDGGLVEISVDGRAFLRVPTSVFRFNPYNSTLESSADGNDNPLAGRWAFTGSDGGSIRGSWGQTQIPLDWIAGPGQTVVIRFAFGVDGCNGLDGWYLDRVQIVGDAQPPPRRGAGRSGG